ncbi:MAG TPA: type IV pilin protein [Candidatus Acidoferrales bacterium]|nr:type IV pilin protein [Candidatus Acidoferrales bacterium]
MNARLTSPTSRTPRAGGFTLIEIMIAVVVLSLLLAIAVPSYREQTRKGYRSLATSALMDRAARLERCAALDPNNGFLAANTACPAFPSNVVDEANVALWQITIPTRTAVTFTLQARPVTGSPAAGDTTCAMIQLTHTGARSATDSSNADSTARCW